MQQKQQIGSRTEKPQVDGRLFGRSKTKSPAAKEAPGAIRHSEFCPYTLQLLKKYLHGVRFD
jgi:hypothetical protein